MFYSWLKRRRAANRANNAEPVETVEAFTHELVVIGRTRGFLHGTTGDGDERTREIGRWLCESGGTALMGRVHQDVSSQEPGSSRDLRAAWEGIGDWPGQPS